MTLRRPKDGADFHLRGFRRTSHLFTWLGILKPPPKMAKEVLVQEGLDHPVEVRWDEAGVPRIDAQSMFDALFAQGYLHGRERAFQMDLSRRVPAGQLAELVGESAVPYDHFMRRLNLSYWAKKASGTWTEDTRQCADAYVKGVNLAFGQNPLPPEYRFLKQALRPWTVDDSNLLVYQLAWTLNTIWTAKWGYEQVKEMREIREWLFGPLEGVPHITIIPGTGSPLAWGTIGVGSNNWVVDGAHSKNGTPLLANDPHLMPQLPSIWYEMFIEGGSLAAFGATLPGAPGIIIGQNHDLAWGVTNVDPDVQDLYRIHMESDGLTYMLDGEQTSLTQRQEIFQVRGKPDHVLPCYDSHVGPIIHEDVDGCKIALAWTGFQPLPIMQAILRLNRAHDWESFVNALAEWWVPAQNFVYADRDGHIGYACAARIPTRGNGPWVGCVNGNTKSTQWTGWVDWAEVPRMLDPAQGYAITANNAVVGPEADVFVFGRFSLGHRAKRIEALLTAEPLHDRDSFAKIQMDVYSAPLDQIAGKLRQWSALPENWRRLLASFDGQATSDSPAVTALYLFMLEALPRSLKEVLDQPFFYDVKPGVPGTHPFPERLWVLLGERIGPLVLSLWETIDLFTAVERATQTGKHWFGPDLAQWSWGKAHQAEGFHPFTQVKLLKPLFGRRNLPIAGDLYTPRQAAFALDPELPWPRLVSFMPSYRQIMLAARPEESVAVHLTGQSGHPLSAQYDNLLEPYLNGQFFPLGPGMKTHSWFRLRPK
ncbi:MAG: penicillin acylase family protein [Thermaerobacter sp.]|nr:penicillin acylase family protein [Thermaerobacter sp.]